MNRKMTDFAVGAWCGIFAASGSDTAAFALSSSTIAASAMAASPLPARVKNSRREPTFQWCLSWSSMLLPSVDVKELVRTHQRVAEIHECGRERPFCSRRNLVGHQHRFVARDATGDERRLFGQKVRHR